jgi:hypothetical protein
MRAVQAIETKAPQKVGSVRSLGIFLKKSSFANPNTIILLNLYNYIEKLNKHV